MEVQLLLLVALIGPFCTFTHANPTHFPPTPDVASTAVVEAASHLPTDDTTHIITGPPPTGPATAPEEAVTEDAVAVTEAASVTPAPVSTEKNVIETEAPATAAPTTPAPLLTDSPAVETAAPTEPAETELQPVATGALETHEEVVVENGTDEEQLSSGQVVGIVIGALLAVVIVIAVVIAVFRRMGKYSP